MNPVKSRIEESITRYFVPEDEEGHFSYDIVDGEMIIDPEADDIPDTFSSNRINLWGVVLEELALSTDPFVREKDSSEADGNLDDSQLEKNTHTPFAGLKALITEKNNKN